MTNLINKLHWIDLSQIKWQIFTGPTMIIIILSMMILPLPPFLLDLFFTFNIVLSIMILLAAMFTTRTLDFVSFPIVLLFSTLMRLALNVASVRVILLHGHQGEAAAGQVINAFGHFLVGGNSAIGIVVFSILVIINFMVITKGAGRIAEVGARFALDGMPGKQMAIDADLSAGIIGEEEAKRRRSEVTQEADFYGSMDGASKFVRGDAVAGLLIMAINLIGGLLVGIMQYDMDFRRAGKTYTLLTIGDGLVAQIPALVISTAAGVIVTRVATHQNVGEQIVSQLFSNPRIMILSAIVIGLLGIVPGMPNIVFLFFTLSLFGIALLLRHYSFRDGQLATAQERQNLSELDIQRGDEASWDDVQPEDALGLEIGYRLIPMLNNKQEPELLNRIRGIRKKFAREMGYLPPVVHIRDNLEMPSTHYRILLYGVEIGFGDIHPERYMAINPGTVNDSLHGEECHEPAFGLPAVWIDKVMCEEAKTLGYTVVDSSTVIATHFNQLIIRYADELLGRQEVQQLLEHLGRERPKLTEDLIPNVFSLTTLHKVLRNLLVEQVSIRNISSIVECLAENTPQQNDIDILTNLVRHKLARAITQRYFPITHEIRVIGLELELEQTLIQAVQNGGALEPGIADQLIIQTEKAIQQQLNVGDPVVILVNPVIRSMLSRFLRRSFPQLAVLASTEIADNRSVHFNTMIGLLSK